MKLSDFIIRFYYYGVTVINTGNFNAHALKNVPVRSNIDREGETNIGYALPPPQAFSP